MQPLLAGSLRPRPRVLETASCGRTDGQSRPVKGCPVRCVRSVCFSPEAVQTRVYNSRWGHFLCLFWKNAVCQRSKYYNKYVIELLSKYGFLIMDFTSLVMYNPSFSEVIFRLKIRSFSGFDHGKFCPGVGSLQL